MPLNIMGKKVRLIQRDICLVLTLNNVLMDNFLSLFNVGIKFKEETKVKALTMVVKPASF